MSFFDGLSEALAPHTNKLNDTIAVHGSAIYAKLHAIEKANSDLARGDIGDHWDRIIIKRHFEAEENFVVREVPLSEIFSIQAIVVDGIKEKSPAFIILGGGVMIHSVIKEGIGFEGIGGDQIFLPGEKVEVQAREAGNINCVITVIRRLSPVEKAAQQMGRGTEFYGPHNVHEVSRDVIMSRNGLWTEPQPEVAAEEGLKETLPVR
jgi:hypothetical protein